MQCDRYLIVPAENHWTVQHGMEVLGTFSEKGEAIQAAIARLLIRKVRATG